LVVAVRIPLFPRQLFAGGAVFVLAAVLPPPEALAAVVRSVRAFPSESFTRIVVEIDGEFRYRTGASDDGHSVLIDIGDATLGEHAPRLLPVSDRRVDGVILLRDDTARIVRVSVDVAGRVAPRLEARIDASRLVLDFVDAAAAAAAPEAPSPASPVSRTVAGPVAEDKERAAARVRIAAMQRAGSGSAHADVRPNTRVVPPSTVASRKPVVQKPVVVLDPGHGGKDPGARAWTGEYEKDIVLDLAERVARRLRSRGDIEVVMTRSGDEYVALSDRRDSSRKWSADAFVSIHANASRSAAARGFETYYHSRTTTSSSTADRATRRLVRVENGGKSGRGGSSREARLSPASLPSAAAPVLDRRAESARLARIVQGELVRQLGMRYEAVRDLGAKEGPFFVIGDNAAPSVLVEAAFLTHREEGLRMRSEVYREQIADGVARGIVAFLDQQRRTGAL